MPCDYIECFVSEQRHRRCSARVISRCWPEGAPLEHQHVPKKSQGGRRAEAVLCNAHHGSCDSALRYNGRRLGNRIDTEPGEPLDKRTYVIFDRDTREVLVEEELGVLP